MPKKLKNKFIAVLLLIGLMVPYFASAQDSVNLKVEVIAAPSVTKNDFDFSKIGQVNQNDDNQDGKVLGAQSERKTNKLNRFFYLILLINPFLII